MAVTQLLELTLALLEQLSHSFGLDARGLGPLLLGLLPFTGFAQLGFEQGAHLALPSQRLAFLAHHLAQL